MFLRQDHRSRAIGVIAAIGVLITGVVVDRTTSPDLEPRTVQVVALPPAPLTSRPAVPSRLEMKCDYFC